MQNTGTAKHILNRKILLVLIAVLLLVPALAITTEYVHAASYTIKFTPTNGKMDGNGMWGSSANTANPATLTVNTNSPAYSAVGKAARSGYTFNGWWTATSGGTQVYGPDGGARAASGYWSANGNGALWLGTTNLNLYAQWTANSYTQTFNCNGGVKGAEGTVFTRTMTMGAGSNNEMYPPTRTGYTFTGWYDAQTGGTQVYKPVSAISTKAVPGCGYWSNTNPVQWSYAGAKTFYARWTPNTYTMAYTLNGGTHGSSHPTSATYDVQFTVSAPTRTGYDFNGWNITNMDSTEHKIGNATTSAGSVNNSKATTFMNLRSTSGQVNFSAQWTEKTAKLKYNANGHGTAPADVDMKYTTATNAAAAITATGYTFDSWNTKANGTGTRYAAGAQVKAANVIPAETTLYAIWRENTAQLTYNANGHCTAPAAVTMRYSTATNAAQAITATGYTFDSWNTKADGTGTRYAAGAQVKAANVNPTATTLYAKWNANTYSIAYAGMNGATFGASHPTSATYDATFTVNNPTRTGYTFFGWKVTGMDDTPHNFENTITNATEYTASPPVTSFKNLRATSRTVTFTAQWTPKTNTVSFNGNRPADAQSRDNVEDVPANITVTYDANTGYHVGTPSCKGFTFLGWYDAQDNKVYDETGTCTTEGNYWSAAGISGAWKGLANLRLNAKWEANTYSVQFMPNQGTGSMTVQEDFHYGTAKTLSENAFTRDGYTFSGWNTASDGSGTAYTDKQAVKYMTDQAGATVKLYAQWTPITYNVHFDANDGDGQMQDQSLTYDQPQNLRENTFTRHGYDFLGWARDPQATVQEFSDKHSIGNGNNLTTTDGDTVTLYAVWKAKEYTVHFNANGGDGEMEDQRLTYDTPQALTANAFTRGGWRFIGWTLSPMGEGAIPAYTNSEEVLNLMDEPDFTGTLYALWESVDAFGFDPTTVSGIRYEEFEAENGSATFEGSIRPGEAFYIPGIDIGARYDVTEKGKRDYKPSYKFSEGKEDVTRVSGKGEQGDDLSTTREALNKNTQVDYTNEKVPPKMTAISISKEVLGDKATEEDQNTLFTFWYSLSGLDPQTEYTIDMEEARQEDITFTSDEQGRAEGTVSLTSAQKAIFYLPDGAVYRFEEVLREAEQPESRFTPSFDVSRGADYTNTDSGYGEGVTGHGLGIQTDQETVVSGKEVQIDFKNAIFETHDLRIAKKAYLDGELLTGQAEEFSMRIDFRNLEHNKAYMYTGGSFTADANGKATVAFTLKSDEEIIFSDIPGTASFDFGETPSEYLPGVTVTDESGRTIISEVQSLYGGGLGISIDAITADTDVDVTNEKNTRNRLSVTKQFTGALADESDSAEFIIRIFGLEPGSSYETEKGLTGEAEETITVTNEEGFTYRLLSPCTGTEAVVTCADVTIGTFPVSENTITLSAQDVQTIYDTIGSGQAKVTYETSSEQTSGSIRANLKGECEETVTLGPNERFAILQLPENAVYRIEEKGSEGVSAAYGAVGRSELALKSSHDKGKIGESLSTPDETMQFDRDYIFTNVKDIEPPEKTVSDDDNITLYGTGEEKNVKENTVGKGLSSVWNYTITQEISVPVASFTMTDELPPFTQIALTGENAAQFIWESPDGTQYGGTAVRGGQDDEFVVKDGERNIFRIEADGENPQGSISIQLIDQDLLAGGGKFTAQLTASLAEGTTEEDLIGAGLATVNGYAVTNQAYSLIGDETYETEPVDTNFFVPKGLTIRKNVPQPGDPDEPFEFKVKLSGLEPGEQYSYSYAGIITAKLSQKDGIVSISARNTAGNSVKNVKAHIYEDDELIGSIVTGKTDSIQLYEGDFTAEIEYKDQDPVFLSFRITEDDEGNLIYEGRDTANVPGGGREYTFSAKADGTAVLYMDVKHGQQVTFTDLPNRAGYAITEEASDYQAAYEVIYGQSSVTASALNKENSRPKKALSSGEQTLYTKNPPVYLFTNTIPSEPVIFSKTSVNGTEELPGAHLYVIRGEYHPLNTAAPEEMIAQLQEQDIADDWISGSQRHEIELARGEVYTMVEVTAPQGHERAEDIVFRVTHAGTIEVRDGEGNWQYEKYVHMKDTQDFEISVKKLEPSTGMFVPGAQLTLYGPNVTIVKQWISGMQEEKIEGLSSGKYTLSETRTPEDPHYVAAAADIEFEITDTGYIVNCDTEGAVSGNTIRMYDEFDPPITISKKDINGSDEITGAKLTVTQISGEDDLAGETIDSWTSTDQPHGLDLVAGREYELTERIAPQYYELTESIRFKVSVDGNVLIRQQDGTFTDSGSSELTMLDKPSETEVTFSKTEVNRSEEIPGAVLSVYEGEGSGGTLVERWTSATQKHEITLKEGHVYTMVETTAPNGYEVAESITFRITDDGKVEIKNGAHWEAQSENLIHMEDEPTPVEVKFSKRAVNGTDELPGAVLEVREGEGTSGKLVEDGQWTSSASRQKKITLSDNHVYTMIEHTPPEYYEPAENIVFRIKDGEVQIKQTNGTWLPQAQNLVRMLDTRSTSEITFSKKAINGSAELPGAYLDLLEGEDTTVRVAGGGLKGYALSLTEKDEDTVTLRAQSPSGAPAKVTLRLADGTSVATGNDGTKDISKEDYADMAGKDVVMSVSSGLAEKTSLPAGVGNARSMGSDYSWVSAAEQKTFTLEEGRVYTMVETRAPESPESYKIAESIVFRINDDGKVEIRNASGQWQEKDEKLVVMKDAPDRTYNVTLKKRVTGDLGDRTKQFEFTAEFTGLIPGRTYNKLADGTTDESLKAFTADAEGKASVNVKLRGGEEAIFGDLGKHVFYAVTEKASDHVASYAIAGEGDEPVIVKDKDTNGNVSAKALSTKKEEVDAADGDVRIVYSNNRDYATITGVQDTLRIRAAALVVILIVGLIYAQMRRRSGLMLND